ncbi:MAG TPA: MFS transporter [Nocardioidaceae bacterium]|nr:MFS transporter [Nocardioidaceae bacterium]
MSLLSAVAANAAAGTLFAWSILIPPLSAEIDRQPEDLGIVFSTALVVFAGAVLFGGRSVDRRGPRRALVVAGVVSGGGLAVAAAAQDLAMLLVGFGVLFGFGSGLTYLSTVAWASLRGPQGRTFETGLVVAAYAAGPMLAAPLGTLGIEALGWRGALGLAAVAVSGALLLSSRGMPGPSSTGRDDPPSAGSGAIGDPVALTALWLLFLGVAAAGLLAFAYAAPIATERGTAAGTVGLVVALMALGNLAGRLLPGPLTARFGLLTVLWAALLMLGIAAGTLAYLTTSPLVAVAALALIALQYGMVSAMLPAATRLVARDARFAAAYGRVFSSFGVAAVAGPALGALLHNGGDGYAGGFEASLLGAALAVLAMATYQRRLRPTASPTRP